MKLLVVVHQYGPHYVGGTETYTRSLAERLSLCGHSVLVVTRVRQKADAAQSIQKSEENGVQVWRVFDPEPTDALGLFYDSYANRGALRALQAAVGDFAPDLIHIQHLKGLHYGIAALARSRGIPAVLTLHDYWFYCGNAQLIRPKQHACDGPMLWLNCADCAAHRVKSILPLVAAPAVAALFAARDRRLREVVNGAKRIVAPSRHAMERYAGYYANGSDVRLIEHGIEPLPVYARVPRSPGAPLRVLFAGGLSPQKGLHVLVQAVQRARPGAVQLDVCGDDRALPDYADAVRRLALGLPIHFHGLLGRTQLAKRVSECDVLAVPSLWPETSSLIAQEAQAYGCPVVASDIGALRERIASERDGYLVAPGDVPAWTAMLERLAAGQATEFQPCQHSPKLMSDHANEIARLFEEVVGERR